MGKSVMGQIKGPVVTDPLWLEILFSFFLLPLPNPNLFQKRLQADKS